MATGDAPGIDPGRRALTPVVAGLEGIRRSFGSVVALDGADLELQAGEIHGVLGANGAGKSTLFNVLGGMLRPDAGSVQVEGQAVSLTSPRDAWRHGIGLVHQHFTLVPRLTVTENLALGSRGREGRLPVVRRAAREVMERTGLTVPLDRAVESLGVGDRQRIEILKVLLRDPRVLVLDEPTAVLTPDETRGLFDLLRELAGEGRAVALVAHKIDEVLSVAHRVTVLRSGKSVLTAHVSATSKEAIVRAMVGDAEVDAIALGIRESRGPTWPSDLGGRDGLAGPDANAGAGPGAATRTEASLKQAEAGRAVAELVGVHVPAESGPGLADIDLEVRRGEIVGVAGVDGNGQRELALVTAGRLAPQEGTATLPEAVGFISQDRSREGLIADFDLTENVALAFQRKDAYRRGPWLRWDRLDAAAGEIRSRYDVQAPSTSTLAGSLSGGNQQRLIVGRELAMATELLVAENPTRGLDIAAAAFVHQELTRLADEGVAVVLISTDLDEVLALSHRLFAIARGRLVEVPDEERSREGVGALMLGADRGADVHRGVDAHLTVDSGDGSRG